MNIETLISCGDIIELDIQFDKNKMLNEIDQFNGQWPVYNPRKENNRYGLSITSFNGDLSGIPDLDSIPEYNKENGTHFTEQNFVVTTPVYNASEEVQRITRPFKDYMCRSHFIQINRGGFFPLHRDLSRNTGLSTFRIIGFVNRSTYPEFVFLMDNKIFKPKEGVLYFINTRKEHMVFSTVDSSIQLILNVIESGNSIKSVIDHILVD